MSFQLLHLPTWDQLNDPWAGAGNDPYATQDCGEECVAEVLWYFRRETLSAFQIRAEMPGHANSGLTTSADLVSYLQRHGLTADAVEPSQRVLRAIIRAEVDAGRPSIVLGYYAGMAELHWITTRGVGDGRVGWNDPWHGLYRETSWAWFTAHYQGSVVRAGTRPPWG